MKKLRRKSVGLCILPQLMKSRKDARKFKRLYTDAEINVQIEKRHTKLERRRSHCKDRRFSGFRHRKHEEYIKERQEFRTLEININGQNKKFEVD